MLRYDDVDVDLVLMLASMVATSIPVPLKTHKLLPREPPPCKTAT